jgi:hypothetical protein
MRRRIDETNIATVGFAIARVFSLGSGVYSGSSNVCFINSSSHKQTLATQIF